MRIDKAKFGKFHDFIFYFCKKRVLWYRTGRNKKKYYSSVSHENLHTYVKLKIKWGDRHELYSIFFIENVLFTENVKKGVRGIEPNGRTVQPTQLILTSIEVEFFALQNYREIF